MLRHDYVTKYKTYEEPFQVTNDVPYKKVQLYNPFCFTELIFYISSVEIGSPTFGGFCAEAVASWRLDKWGPFLTKIGHSREFY